jgi:23S rRNA (cytosine1962-C5)-methyltransferase
MNRRFPNDRAPRRVPGSTVTLKPGREKPVRQRHPWIFSGAIDAIGDSVDDGAVADVRSADGEFLARGSVNRRSQIVVRVLTFRGDEAIDSVFWESRLERALGARPNLSLQRCVNAESDGLPGLVVDRYAGFYVLSASTLGMERHKPEIVRALERLAAPRGIYDRSDVDGREKEGLPKTSGLLAGEEPPELIHVEEATHDGRSVTLLVDVRRGHKTGAYLDQSENRRTIAAHTRGATILNLFSYTGGFSLHAAAAGAKHALNVDSSEDALALSARIAVENRVEERVEHLRADAFEALRAFREQGRTFDVIVVDPPKFAHSAAQVDRAARAYKDLARVAMQIVRPGGLLATFSCSGAVSPDLFQKIAFSASLEAGRTAQIIGRLSQASDHPVCLSFPEGEYLKGLLCRVS